jgi:hypothetical protein
MKLFGLERLLPEAAPKPDPSAPPERFGVWLRKGTAHVVNGEHVFIPRSGAPDEPDEPDDALLELPLGKHVVNGVQTWVRDPAEGLEVGAP